MSLSFFLRSPPSKLINENETSPTKGEEGTTNMKETKTTENKISTRTSDFDPTKYLYRFSLGKEVVAETYGLKNAEKVYTSFAPQLKGNVTLSVYLKVESSPAGLTGQHLSEIFERVASISSKKKEKGNNL